MFMQSKISAKAHWYTAVAIITLILVELSVIYIAEYFGLVLLLFIFGPLALLFATIYWIHKVTGLRCLRCKNFYGVSIGQRGWPRVPSHCLYCGTASVLPDEGQKGYPA